MSETNIYVLKLQHGKYYVGKSDYVNRRCEEHFNGKGSLWTRKHKPLSIEKIVQNVSPFEEDKVVKEYMLKYGIDNVRGGAYVTEELANLQIENLNTELWAAEDKCTQCGRAGHFVNNCYAKTDVNGYRIEFEDEDEEEDECIRCGRLGHSVNSCYARIDVDGYPL